MPRRGIALGVTAVLVVAIGGLFWWYTARDAPEEVSLDKAVAGLDGSSQATGDGNEGSDPESSTSVEGKWSVDTATGGFDFESATGTFVGFRVEENLARIGSATAVGRTGDVAGSITIEGTELTDGSFTVDMATITTNQSRRDDKVRDALGTSQFPTAGFELTEPVDLGPEAGSGAAVKATVVGDLTLHGVTRGVEVAIDAKLVDGTIVIVGSTPVTFSDFGVEVPSSPIVLSAEDHGIVEMQLLMVRGQPPMGGPGR